MNATVKRKLNALMQSVGSSHSRPSTPDSTSNSPRPSASWDALASTPNRSTTSLSNMDPDDYKKRRVGAPLTKPPAALGSIHTVGGPAKTRTSISNITLRKWHPGSEPNGTETAPKYCPGDRDQLLRRLATFQELTDWAPKPERVGEIEWARRGWICLAKERVKCILCNKELAVKLNFREVMGKEVSVMIASDVEEAMVEKYSELITTAHEEDCLWRRKGCDEYLLRLPFLQTPHVALEGLRQRYDELCIRKDFLPYEFNLRLPEGFDLDGILLLLPSTFFTDPPPTSASAGAETSSASSPKVNRTALALAMLGWQGLSNSRIGQVPNSASCHSCLRRLGLWMFKSKQVDPDTNAVLVPAPMDHLDPLREHRFFCPWKSGKAQRNAGAPAKETDKPGWEILLQTLRNDAFVRRKANLAATPAHGRSQSTATPPRAAHTAPTTPTRPTTAGGRPVDSPATTIYGPGDEDDMDEETKRKKDKDMMARLRRVKSLFNSKAASKLKRTPSRPGTAQSKAAGE